MTLMEQKFDVLAAYVLAEDEQEKETARKALTAVMRTGRAPAVQATTDDEDVGHQFLMEIGAPPQLQGYRYCVYGILQAAMHPDLIDQITCGFYPKVAVEFDTTVSRVGRSIRHLIEKIWDFGDAETLHKYFGQTYSIDKDKPTNSNFIARSAIIVRTRLKK